MRSAFDRLAFSFISFAMVNALACGSRSDDPPDGGAAGSSGAGGSGGTAGTGGAAGSTAGAGGSAGSSGAATGDSGICGCVTGHVGWGWDGGRVAYRDTSALEVCNLFVHQRAPIVTDPPTLACEQQMTDCAGAIGPGDVVRSIAHDDVRAAISAAPVLYGEDPRAYDGQMLRIQIGSAIIEVGHPCREAVCKPIPAGVDALARQLPLLTKQELAREPCRSTFPSLN
jgi:hypothetical protein